MTPDERARAIADRLTCFVTDEDVAIIAAAIREAEDRAWQQAKQIADDYSDWTYWGQYDNAAAAQAAADEIAAAIEKRRPLTSDEIRELDTAKRKSYSRSAIREAREGGYATGLEDGNSEMFATFQAVADDTFGIETYNCDGSEDFIRTVMEYAKVAARNAALEEAAGMAKKYLLFVFDAHPEINVLATDLHASILALKDKPEGENNPNP